MMPRSFKEELAIRLIRFIEPRKDLFKHKKISRLNYNGQDLALITHGMMRALLRNALCRRKQVWIENLGHFVINGSVIIFETDPNAMCQLYNKLQKSPPLWIRFFNNWRSLNDKRIVYILNSELENAKERPGVEIAEIAYRAWVSIVVWALSNRKRVSIAGIGRFVSVTGVIQYTASPMLQEDLNLSLKSWPLTKLKIDKG